MSSSSASHTFRVILLLVGLLSGAVACGGEQGRTKIEIVLTPRSCTPACSAPTYKLYVVRDSWPLQCLLGSTAVAAREHRGTVAGPSIQPGESLWVGVIVTCPEQPDCAVCHTSTQLEASASTYEELLLDSTAACDTQDWQPDGLAPCPD